VWEYSPDAPDSLTAFSVEDAALPVWRARLPGSMSAAASHVAAAERAVTDAMCALPAAELRLSHVLEVLSSAHGGVGPTSFASPAAPPSFTDAEVELVQGLAELRESGNPASFGISDWKDGWNAAIERASVTLAQLHAGLTAGGVVETQVGGELIGRTHLQLIGTEHTVWRADCTAAEAELHSQTVGLSVASRIALVSMLGAALRGAARASAVLAVPGGPLLLVPSVFRFIRAAAAGPGRGR
jgi:hypothetical protein